jgi:3-hydroxyisobutyrate dehydrogenase
VRREPIGRGVSADARASGDAAPSVRAAFLGLGHLGGDLCDLAIRRGLDVTVFDPDPAAVAPRARAGATVATSPAAAARGVDVVCVVVRDDAQAREAVEGPDGVLAGIAPDGIVVLHSTVAPGTVRELAASCAARGVRFIDAAIGATTGRDTGEMYAMCGGDEATIDAVRPVLGCYAKHIVRFGDVGTGMAAKLARNLVQYCMWTAVHEGRLLAMGAGLDADAFADLVRTSGVSGITELALGSYRTTPAARGGQLERIVTLAWKDLDDAFALADEAQVATPLAHVAQREIGRAMGLDIEPGG